MTDRNDYAETELNIALLIDADNASPDHLDEVLLVLGELGTINIRRAYGNWAKTSLKGWGDADRPAFDRPDAAVRRGQGQELDRHADDDRRDGPALSRPCRRLRHHVVATRDFLPLAQRIREDGLPVYGFGTAKTPDQLPAGLHPLLRRRRAGQPTRTKRSRRRPPAEGQRAIDAELLQVLGAAFKASKRDEEGYASLSEMGQRAKAVSSFAVRNYGFTRRQRPDQGGAQFRHQGRRGRAADGQAAALGGSWPAGSQFRNLRCTAELTSTRHS